MNRVDELTQECFNAVIMLRKLDANAVRDPAFLQEQIKRQIDAMMRRGQQLGVPHEDIQEMAYAIVALLDEVAVKGPVPLSQFWSNSLLQMHYFQENVAGESFFARLDTLKAAKRIDALQVYYICLLLGFVGRYAMQGNEMELQDIVSSTRFALVREVLHTPETLSPNAERPSEPMAKEDKGFRFLWLPVGAIVVAGLLYVILAAMVRGKADELLDTIQAFLK